MPILYTVISRVTTVLAKHAECVGNFAEVTEQVMQKIKPENRQQTYTLGGYMIPYICEDRIIYMCITDDLFDRSRAFAYLTEVKRRFIETYGLQAATAIAYAMNTEFSLVLAFLQRNYNEASNDKLVHCEGEVVDLREVVYQAIDNLTSRGERLDLLVDQTERLQNTSVSFQYSSRQLARQMYWRNVKMYVIMGAVGLFFLYVIVSMSCGGLLWQSCIHRS